jgi:thiamine biosynthesis lipoprotein
VTSTGQAAGDSYRRVLPVMGTITSFDVRRIRIDPDDAARAVEAACDWLRWVDATFSTYQPESQLSRLRRGELRLRDCDPQVAVVLDLCAQAAAETDGFFTALIGGAVDPTGIVKGWAAQEASVLLRRAGLSDHVVNAGGDVACAGEPGPGEPWRVGVADPYDRNRVLVVVPARDEGVATSGVAERGEHVIDPRTGAPATRLLSATVVGPDLTRADAYATAVIAGGDPQPSWFGRLDGYTLLTVDRAGVVRRSDGFPG